MNNLNEILKWFHDVRDLCFLIKVDSTAFFWNSSFRWLYGFLWIASPFLQLNNHAPSLLVQVTAQLLLCNPLAIGFGEFANSIFQLKMPEVVYLENMANNR